jgi:hypothetical protein
MPVTILHHGSSLDASQFSQQYLKSFGIRTPQTQGCEQNTYLCKDLEVSECSTVHITKVLHINNAKASPGLLHTSHCCHPPPIPTTKDFLTISIPVLFTCLSALPSDYSSEVPNLSLQQRLPYSSPVYLQSLQTLGSYPEEGVR